MIVYELRDGKFHLLPEDYVSPEAADTELDGFLNVEEWYLHKVTTRLFVLVFPCLGLWPTVSRLKAFQAEYFQTSEIPSEILNDRRIVFWPKQISHVSKRPGDIVIGRKGTTTISYLKEVKDYVLNLYPEPYLDYCFDVLVTDVHFPRVKRDFALIMKIENHHLLFIPHIINTNNFSTHTKFARREKLILSLSSLYPSLYVHLALKKGGLK